MIFRVLLRSIRMLSGFRSWWIISLRCMARKPRAIWSTVARPGRHPDWGCPHPLAQGLAFDVLDHAVKKGARRVRDRRS